ncbi:hypothetical protein Tco_0300627 [Tanacetum coccineum]
MPTMAYKGPIYTKLKNILGGVLLWYGYIKNRKKTVKNGQAHQKSTKRSQRIKAEARKVKPQSNPVKEKSTHGQRSTKDVGFALDPLTELAQHVTSKNDMLAILRCPQCDPTAIKLDQKIEMNEGYGLKAWEETQEARRIQGSL